MLRIRDLRKGFNNPAGEPVEIIDIAALELEAGKQVALAGSSGSGKTTLLNLIAGILTPDTGQIEVDGKDITTLSEAKRDRFRAASIGYIFQTFNLLQGFSALENVMLGMSFGGKPDRARATSLLERVGLGERLRYRPAELSVGQQQRVAVARALANQPKLVLADEPTGNLDQARAKEAMSLIRAICEEQHAALLLVSHDPNMMKLFEQVVPLDEINRVAHTATSS